MEGDFSNSELATLAACDVPEGLSTEGYIPGKEHLQSMVERGLLEVVKSELVGGWRRYEWFRTTDSGRAVYASEMAPIAEW